MIPAAFAPLASHLWQSTVFATLAGLLTLAMRRNQARVRYWIWVAASYKFLIPFSWLVSIGHQFEWRAAPAIMPLAFSAVTDVVNGPIFLTALPVANSAPNHLPVFFFVIWTVWASGFLTVTIGWLREWVRIRTIARAASPLPLGLPIQVLSTPARLEPGVFGIFRPVLLLPVGIAARLSQGQLQAVLAHELCHVRRRDNLAAAVHMLVEALFWFHPLVWWLGARMVDERERACDEEVLRSGSQAQVYAESILKVCEFYLVSPLTCISGVTGSDLKERIQRIMRNHFGVALGPSKKLFLATAAMAALAVPVIAGVLTAPAVRAPSSTTPQDRLKFDTVSIKVNTSFNRGPNPGPGNIFLRDGIWRANHFPLRLLIALEYMRLFTQSRLIIGGPSWVDSELFDIEGKANGNPGKDQMRLMAQSLLEDHFKLIMHYETRQVPVYLLVLSQPGKTGPQLTPHSDEAKCSMAPLAQPGPDDPMPSYCEGFFMNPRPGDLRETGNKITMEELGDFLSESADRMIVDQTGLSGVFDFSIEYAPQVGPGSEPSPAGAPVPSAPSIFTALPEQLGLKLEPQTAPMEVLVIDHVEEPSPN